MREVTRASRCSTEIVCTVKVDSPWQPLLHGTIRSDPILKRELVLIGDVIWEKALQNGHDMTSWNVYSIC